MMENSKIGRIIFFRIRSSTGYKISENLDRISARRKLCGDSVPCVIWTDALDCTFCTDSTGGNSELSGRQEESIISEQTV